MLSKLQHKMDSDFMHLEFIDKRIRRPIEVVPNQNEATFHIGEEDANIGPTKTQRKLFSLKSTQNDTTFQIGNDSATMEPGKTSKKLFQVKTDDHPPYGVDSVKSNQPTSPLSPQSPRSPQSPIQDGSLFKLEKTNAAKLSSAQKLVFTVPRRNYDFTYNRQQAKEALLEISKAISPSRTNNGGTQQFTCESESYNSSINSPRSIKERQPVNGPFSLNTGLPTLSPTLDLTEQEENQPRTPTKKDPVEIHKQSYYQSLSEAEQRKQPQPASFYNNYEETETGRPDLLISPKQAHKLTYESQPLPNYNRQTSKDAYKNFHESQIVITQSPQILNRNTINNHANGAYSTSIQNDSSSRYGADAHNKYGTAVSDSMGYTYKDFLSHHGSNIGTPRSDSSGLSDTMSQVEAAFDRVALCQCCARAGNQMHVPYNKVLLFVIICKMLVE